MYAEGTKSVHLKLDPSQHLKLKQFSRKTGAPVNLLIRRAVDTFLRLESSRRARA